MQEDPYVDQAILIGCDALIIGASSFGWWAAYLSKIPGRRIVAPQVMVLPGSDFADEYVVEDYYPPDWMLLDNWSPR